METRNILVTGSSRGIGKAIAFQLSAQGFAVTLHGRTSSATLEEVREEIASLGNPVHTITFDVSSREEAAASLESHVSQNGAFYGVVLNAGIHRDGPFAGMDGDEWDSVLRCNLDGFYNVLRPLVMPMIQLRSGGRIVALSSLAGVVGNRGQVNYSASKAGLIGAAKALSKELAKRHITVNCVAPGFVDTDMTEGLSAEEIKKIVPMRRAARPEEVASLVSYLLSEQAGYITGQTISINGGIA